MKSVGFISPAELMQRRLHQALADRTKPFGRDTLRRVSRERRRPTRELDLAMLLILRIEGDPE